VARRSNSHFKKTHPLRHTLKSAGPVSRKNGGPGGGIVYRASHSFHAEGCTAAFGTAFPVGPPPFFADTPARKCARNVERVFTIERLAVALDTSITYDISSAPIFRKTVTVGRFLKELLSVFLGGGRFLGSFKKDKHEETA
jgi:hypothetical protein